MAKRFGRLNNAIKLFQPRTGDLTVPSGSDIERYYQYTRGARPTRTTDQEITQPSRNQYKLVPINSFMFTPTEKFRVKVTGRTFDVVDGSGANLTGRATYNWLADTEEALFNSNFKPAKAIISLITGTDAVNHTSYFTGFTYKSFADDSYTVPFGEKATSPVGEGGMQDAIMEALQGDDGHKYVYTFTPEKRTRR